MRFTVRRPPIGEVSPCCHRPSGGDVACSVHVGVAPPGSAGLALEDRLALAVPGRHVPTRGATLRRVRSRDLLDPAGSLVLQTYDELAPTASTDRAVEPAFLCDLDTRLLDGATRGAGHRPHVKSLDPDQIEPPRQIGSGFLDPVLTPIPLAGLQLCDGLLRPFATVRATLAARKPLLQNPQPLRLTRAKTGRVQQFAGRQRSRHRHPAVNADHDAVARTGDGIGNVRKRDMPAARPITSNPVGLHTTWHRPRQPKPHPTDLRYPHPTKAAIQPLDLIRLQTDLPKPFMHTGFAPRRTTMRTGEEIAHRLRKIAQRLLLNPLTSGAKPGVFGPGLRQLRALPRVTRRLAPGLPILLLLHRQIPHIPRVPTMPQQRLLLLRSRQQPKPRHIRTVTATTDNLSRVMPTSLGIDVLPVLRSRVASRRKHP